MRWTDTYDIVGGLIEWHPDIDPLTVRFTDLMEWVMALPGFKDTEENCSERILEAIQMAWIDELD